MIAESRDGFHSRRRVLGARHGHDGACHGGVSRGCHDVLWKHGQVMRAYQTVGGHMHALVSDIVAEWVRGAVLDAYGAAAGRQAFGHVLSLRCEVDYILSTELTTTIQTRTDTQPKGINH